VLGAVKSAEKPEFRYFPAPTYRSIYIGRPDPQSVERLNSVKCRFPNANRHFLQPYSSKTITTAGGTLPFMTRLLIRGLVTVVRQATARWAFHQRPWAPGGLGGRLLRGAASVPPDRGPGGSVRLGGAGRRPGGGDQRRPGLRPAAGVGQAHRAPTTATYPFGQSCRATPSGAPGAAAGTCPPAAAATVAAKRPHPPPPTHLT